jgi:hypothetical protein
MARDALVGEDTVRRDLYIRKYDPERFASLLKRAKAKNRFGLNQSKAIERGKAREFMARDSGASGENRSGRF